VLYVKRIPPHVRSGVKRVLKRWRWHRERRAVKAHLAALPSAAAPAWQAACDLDVAREVVMIQVEE